MRAIIFFNVSKRCSKCGITRCDLFQMVPNVPKGSKRFQKFQIVETYGLACARVGFRSVATGNPSHEVPHINLYLPVRSLRMIDLTISAYLQVIPLCKQLCTLGWPTDRAAIPVYVQQLWGIPPCFLVSE